jgi:hypothetical protein
MNGKARHLLRGAVAAVLGVAVVTGAARAADDLNSGKAKWVSGLRFSEKAFRIHVPAGAARLNVTLSGGMGDADLYVRAGAPASTNTYDACSNGKANNESVAIEQPAAGWYYITLYGYRSYALARLVAEYEKGNGAGGVNGPGIEQLKFGYANARAVWGVTGSARYFYIHVPANVSQMTLRLKGTSGNPDLYLKRQAMPTTWSYDYRSAWNAANEKIVVQNPKAGTWYVMVHGRSAYASATLTAVRTIKPQNSAPLTIVSPAPNVVWRLGQHRLIRWTAPAGVDRLLIQFYKPNGQGIQWVSLADVKAADGEWMWTIPNQTFYVTTLARIRIVDKDDPGNFAVSGALRILPNSIQPVTPLHNNHVMGPYAGAKNSTRIFRIYVPAGKTVLRFRTWGGTGDADIYAACGAIPSISTPFRSSTGGNGELVTIHNPKKGAWYVMVKGCQHYDGLMIRARFLP